MAGLAGAPGLVTFLPGCFVGSLAVIDGGRVSTWAYSARKRRFMMGSSDASSVFGRFADGGSGAAAAVACAKSVLDAVAFCAASALSCSASWGI